MSRAGQRRRVVDAALDHRPVGIGGRAVHHEGDVHVLGVLEPVGLRRGGQRAERDERRGGRLQQMFRIRVLSLLSGLAAPASLPAAVVTPPLRGRRCRTSARRPAPAARRSPSSSAAPPSATRAATPMLWMMSSISSSLCARVGRDHHRALEDVERAGALVAASRWCAGPGSPASGRGSSPGGRRRRRSAPGPTRCRCAGRSCRR